MTIHFVVHEEGDSVGTIVVEGVKAGDALTGWIMEQDKTVNVKTLNDIPIGHKIALKELRTATPSSSTASTSAARSRRSRLGEYAARAQREDQEVVSMAIELGQGDLPGATGAQNGRVGVRNHVVILPVDDISNAAARASRGNIPGTMAMPHPYGRLQFGADLELHFRTLIGTGANPNVAAVVVIGIEPAGRSASSTASPRPASRSTASRSRATATSTRSWTRRRRRRSSCSDATALQRERGAAEGPLGHRTKCGESDTTSGFGANPTVGNAFDKLYPHGATLVLRRDVRAHRRRAPGRRSAAATPEVREKFMMMFDRYQESSTATRRATSRIAADQGQHRRRPDHDRGEGARQHPEDREQMPGRRRDRQGRGADRPRALVHGLVVGGRRDGHAVRRGGLRRALLPDRAGQRDRQPDPAGDQAEREPEDGAHDGRAHRRRRLGAPPPRDQHRPGRRRAARVHVRAPPTAARPPPKRSAIASSC